jgi:hypothetical protein
MGGGKVKSAFTRQALLMAAVVLIIGGLLAALFRQPGDRKAIAISAIVAVVVQFAAFSFGRTVGAGNLTARMGIGALLRFLALVLYAVLVFVLKLPAVAALISLAAFFFVSSVIEPLLVK